MKASHEAENQFHRDAIAGLRREYDQTRDKLAVLLDLRLDKSITQDEYDKKARELKGRQNEIALRIAAPGRRGRLPDHARKPDFRGIASRRHLGAFENRAKARIDRLCLFEPAPKGKKARIFIAFTLRPNGQPGFEPRLTESES